MSDYLLKVLTSLLSILTALNFIGCSTQEKSSKLTYGVNPDAIKIDVIVEEHGMADPHALMKGDTLYIICGHDQTWNPTSSFPMDRWEVWSTTNLKDWQYHRSIHPKDFYIGDLPNCFAGDICERNGKYYWFFSNRYYNTGVAVADQVDGEYKDLLGKPLLPTDIIKESPYDPEIFEEDGVYTICFGSGTYYMATLAEDMKSLSTEPQPILVQTKEGKKIRVSDKSTLFKKGEWYYLVYGNKYAMAKQLYGPYEYQGAFLEGGHTSFFEWTDGQLYVLQENHDISAFYRGASLKPVFFNKDNTILIPEDDRMYPAPGRPFKFKKSTMGWMALNGTEVTFEEGKIKGEINAQNATIQSAPWLYTQASLCSKVSFQIKNNTSAKEMKFAVYSRNEGRGFWKTNTEQLDWSEQQWISIPITPHQKEFKTYTIDLAEFSEIKSRIMQVALQPAVEATEGKWEINEIMIY
ncbi:family 43 glycosylhydrolase [Flammeovirga sp. SJP92]|uniref:family 43 glycosylhydrolase n=1 Tax=Flammeovirga sp. SJP92 TaxID=1775430 RepID=UPI0007915D49|nr:family 43 glycosylhydrolase [Flammeovirga sp. SJP92]KXX71721.1 hypothetical protein AVL50_05460 [Flammeovirga sp. SJP92]